MNVQRFVQIFSFVLMYHNLWFKFNEIHYRHKLKCVFVNNKIHLQI